jgi:hypothetical protein
MTIPLEHKLLLSISDVAELTGFRREVISALVNSGTLIAVDLPPTTRKRRNELTRVSAQTRIRRSDLDTWIASMQTMQIKEEVSNNGE